MKSVLALAAFGLSAVVSATGPPAIKGVFLDKAPPANAPAEPSVEAEAPPSQPSQYGNHEHDMHEHGNKGQHHPPPDVHFFTLTGKGPMGAHGPIAQLADGQNRVGGGLHVGQYYLYHGRMMDTHKRPCILTPMVNQWQCDEGGLATTGFGIDKDSKFTYNGNPGFFACPVNDEGEWNIYAKPIPDQKKCVPIVLSVKEMPVPDSCPFTENDAPQHQAPKIHGPPLRAPPKKWSSTQASTPAHKTPTAPAQRPSRPTRPARPAKPEKPEAPVKPEAEPVETSIEVDYIKFKPKATKKPKPTLSAPKEDDHPFVHRYEQGCKKCQSCKNGPRVKPHLIVPVDQTKPNSAFGNGFVGKITPDICTIFDFDIPAELEGKKCSLDFLLPKDRFVTGGIADADQKNVIEGKGTVHYFWLDSPASPDTTWNTKPKGHPMGAGAKITIGEATSIQQGPCPAGRKLGVQVCADANMALKFIQDDTKSPIGLYMNVC